MAEEYELKQVKVRLKLAEAEPLYSVEQINSPDKAVRVMAEALSQMDREYCCVVNLDASNHPINFNVVSIGDINGAQVPIQNVFKSAILSNAASIMMFHNHPSGNTNASREDIDVTKRLIEAGKIMNIPVTDHIIVAGGTAELYSFREKSPDMFRVREETQYSVHEPQPKLDPDRLMVRPTYRNFGVYENIGENRARVLFEGSEQECHDKIRELRDRYRESEKGDTFTIYQLKDDDESLHYIRFESLERLQKDNQKVDIVNYDVVYDGTLKPGTTLDDLYYEFNMRRPLDFRGHSLSVSDVVVLHQDGMDKAFYVDSFGFSELPDFLIEKTSEKDIHTIESLTREKEEIENLIMEQTEDVERFMLETGGSSDRSDEMEKQIDILREELSEVENELQSLYDQMEEEAFADEGAFHLGNRYISIQRTDDGFDYSIYNEEYHLLDGGVLDDQETNLGTVLQDISDELKQPLYDAEKDMYYHSEVQGDIRQSDIAKPVDYDEFMEKVEEVEAKEIAEIRANADIVAEFREKTDSMFVPEHIGGETPDSIEKSVRDMVQQTIDDYGIDARIEDVIVVGSRCRGLENENSDIDVVVSFSGTEREDSFFNTLHEESLFIGNGVKLDINPISNSEHGSLANYLDGVEKYLSEKAQILEENTHEHLDPVRSDLEITREPEQKVTFIVAECGEFHSMGELHENIASLSEATAIYDRLCAESTMNGIPSLGINVHTMGTDELDDMQWDFLSGNRLDLMGLVYQPEMMKNEEVMEALHSLAEQYPDVRVEGRFPDEPSEHETEISSDDLDSVKPVADLSSIELAHQIDEFARDFDLYGYDDAVEDREANINQLKESIDTGDAGYIKEFLQGIIDEEDGSTEDQRKAKELLQKLSEYKPLAKVEEQLEENYNQIDNQLSNIPPDPDEKKEPKHEKEMRIDEHKKARKRISMKEKIAEKKAIISAGEGGAPEKDKSRPNREV